MCSLRLQLHLGGIALVLSIMRTGIYCFGDTGTDMQNLKEYCEDESFKAKCGPDEAIVMTSAVYGRMRIGRCISRPDDQMPCQMDVLSHMDSWCSGRNSCDILVTSLVHVAKPPCPRDYRSYLEASYKCVPVWQPKSESCFQEQVVVSQEGYISSSIASKTGCGSMDAPFIIEASHGQILNLTLLDFSLRSLQPRQDDTGAPPDVCMVLATMKEKPGPTKTVCGGLSRISHSYTSNTNRVQVRLIANRKEEENLFFLIHYKALGCADPPPVQHSMTHRTGPTEAVIYCNSSRTEWTLQCKDGVWSGKTGTCPAPSAASPGGKPLFNTSTMSGGISIAIIAGVAMCVGLIILLVGIMCLKRRRQKSNIPRYGAAGGHYSTEPSYNSPHIQQGAPPDCAKQFQNEVQFYGGNDNRYYPTWTCHGNNVVTTGNAVPPQNLTDTGVFDPQRKTSGSRERYMEHIYESPQFERRDHMFIQNEDHNVPQTQKYFELDPKMSSPVNNNENRITAEKDPRIVSLSSRYST